MGAAGVEVFAQAHARATERAVTVRLVSVSRIACRAIEATEACGFFDTWPARGEEGGATGHASGRARVVSVARQRDLGLHAVLAQAAGVLAGHTGVSPAPARIALRRHAERHRTVLGELAADVIAGRVAPRAVVDPLVERQPSIDATAPEPRSAVAGERRTP